MLDTDGFGAKLNTLLTRLSATWAAKLDSVYTYITATAAAYLTSTRILKLDNLDQAVSTVGGDKVTTRRYSATFNGTATNVVVNITAGSDLNHMRLRMNGVRISTYGGAPSWATMSISGKITSLSQVTFQRNTGITNEVIVQEFEVDIW